MYKDIYTKFLLLAVSLAQIVQMQLLLSVYIYNDLEKQLKNYLLSPPAAADILHLLLFSSADLSTVNKTRQN